MRALPIVLAAAVVSGCGYAPPRSWSLASVAWTDEERAQLEAGAADVVAWTGEPVALAWDAPADGDVARGDGNYTSDVTSKAGIFLAQATTGARLRAVFAHEICHSLGMAHHADPGLMHATAGQVWTRADAAECRRVGLARCAPSDLP